MIRCFKHPAEEVVRIISWNNTEFEIVRRPEIIWVGCIDYANDNSSESDIQKTLKRYREELIDVEKRALICPDWSAALSVNYTRRDLPCAVMFAQESYTKNQNERYDIYIQPAGLWMRLLNDSRAAAAAGKSRTAPYELFCIMKSVANEHGYEQDPDVFVEIEYHCHAEYTDPPHTNYAYIAVREK